MKKLLILTLIFCTSFVYSFAQKILVIEPSPEAIFLSPLSKKIARRASVSEDSLKVYMIKKFKEGLDQSFTFGGFEIDFIKNYGMEVSSNLKPTKIKSFSLDSSRNQELKKQTHFQSNYIEINKSLVESLVQKENYQYILVINRIKLSQPLVKKIIAKRTHGLRIDYSFFKSNLQTIETAYIIEYYRDNKNVIFNSFLKNFKNEGVSLGERCVNLSRKIKK